MKAVIFDYGNVLCAPQPRSEIEAMAAVLQAPVAAFEEAYWDRRLSFDEAGLTPEEYWRGVAAALGRNLSGAALERLTALDNQSWAHPSPVMIGWAAEIRAAGVRTAILSNMPITLRAYLDDHAPWLADFDDRTFSCDLRLSKPAPEIFRHCLEGLGTKPAETLFLDDRTENVRAAQSLGIHSLCFRGPEQAQCEMNGRYHLPVPVFPEADCNGRASRSRSSS